MGFERNSQVKILSKQLNKSFYSTVPEINLLLVQKDRVNSGEDSNNINLNPYFISGFTDAEFIFFSTTIYKNNKLK